VIGTARIQRNHPHRCPSRPASRCPTPPGRQAARRDHAAGHPPGADPLVRPMLVKACWMYAVAAQIRTW
jgi:hypothetical protein